MQIKKANKLREEWGNKPCDHPSLEKEYHNGSATGDYVCKQCGEARWGRMWNKSDKEGSKVNAD